MDMRLVRKDQASGGGDRKRNKGIRFLIIIIFIYLSSYLYCFF